MVFSKSPQFRLGRFFFVVYSIVLASTVAVRAMGRLILFVAVHKSVITMEMHAAYELHRIARTITGRCNLCRTR